MSRREAKKNWPKVEFPIYDREEEQGKSQVAFSTSTTLSGKDDLDRVAVYEVYDQLTNEICVVCEEHDDFLIKPRKNPYPVDCLFTELIFNECIDEHYGISDLEPVAMQQEEMDRVRSAMMVHTKRFNRKYVVDKGNLDNNAKDAIASGEDGVVVEMSDSTSLRPISDAPMSTDIYNYAQIVRNDHREITGINEYMSGSETGGAKTAYETSQIMGGAKVRLSEKSDLVADFCADVAFKDIEIIKKVYPEEEVIEWLGPDKQKYWRTVQQWELQGEHYVEVQVGSTRPIDESAQFQRALLLYQTFRQDPLVRPDALLDTIMRMMNLRDREYLLGLNQTPDMTPQEQMQMQQQQMQAQVPQEPQGMGMASNLPGGQGNQYGAPGMPQMPGMPGGINPMASGLPGQGIGEQQ
jgi:hypothetical protein